MNIPLINSNSKQDINTSLIAIRNAINELSRMKESASVEDLQRQINIINQQIANFNSEFSAINTHLNTIDTNILNLQPVDTVASGNLHSVTSNAVFNRLNVAQSTELYMPSYTSTVADGEQYQLGHYIIPDDGVYAIDWNCYCVNDTQGGTSIGIRITKKTSGVGTNLVDHSFFMDVIAWANAINCNTTRKLKKDDVIGFYFMCANPAKCYSSNPCITRII